LEYFENDLLDTIVQTVTNTLVQRAPRRKGSYGIDAPYMLWIAALLALADVVMGIFSGSRGPYIGAAAILGFLALGLHASRRGKFAVWSELLDEVSLRGDERILDIGCGRGAVLLMAAARLTTGRAVGIDIWNRGDQSGNAEEATQRNAVAEGVAQRVELHTGDMTSLPFDNDSFDVVLSSLAIHNVKGRTARDKALEEAMRVLRPGGRLVIVDIFATRRYRTRLMQLGIPDVCRRGLGWRMWWGGPWAASHVVTATKPA
jgi:arsenite methyltransferase